MKNELLFKKFIHSTLPGPFLSDSDEGYIIIYHESNILLAKRLKYGYFFANRVISKKQKLNNPNEYCFLGGTTNIRSEYVYPYLKKKLFDETGINLDAKNDQDICGSNCQIAKFLFHKKNTHSITTKRFMYVCFLELSSYEQLTSLCQRMNRNLQMNERFRAWIMKNPRKKFDFQHKTRDDIFDSCQIQDVTMINESMIHQLGAWHLEIIEFFK